MTEKVNELILKLSKQKEQNLNFIHDALQEMLLESQKALF